jgi:predicted HicB family RNase H-like nuclease
MRKRVLTKQVAVMLSEELHKQIIEATDRAEISISEFVRESIENTLRQSKGEKTNE